MLCLLQRHILQLCLHIGPLFNALGISRSNEVSLHVVDASLRIHQVLLFLPFDLDHAHDDPINHIDTFRLLIAFRLLVARVLRVVLQVSLATPVDIDI